MLKYLNTSVTDLSGKPIIDPETKEAIGIKSVCTSSILFQDQSTTLTGDQKLARFALAKKIFDSGESVDLSAEEVTLIKECASKAFAPLVYGRLVEALDPKEK